MAGFLNTLNKKNFIASILQILMHRKLINESKHLEMINYYKFVQSSQEWQCSAAFFIINELDNVI